MALSKPIESNTGAVALYHKIHAAQIRHDDRRVDMQVHSFTTEEARRSGKYPQITATVELTFDRIGTDDPIRADLYAALKAMPQFSDANDC